MKKSYKKEYCILFAIVLAAFIGLYKVLEVKEPDMTELKEKISSTADFTYMVEGDAQRLRKLYYINKNDVEDFIFFAPKTNMDASEILVLKAKSYEDIDELKGLIEARIEKAAKSFESYRPDQYELIKDRIFQVRGKYLILIISENSQEVRKVINQEFN